MFGLGRAVTGVGAAFKLLSGAALGWVGLGLSVAAGLFSLVSSFIKKKEAVEKDTIAIKENAEANAAAKEASKALAAAQEDLAKIKLDELAKSIAAVKTAHEDATTAANAHAQATLDLLAAKTQLSLANSRDQEEKEVAAAPLTDEAKIRAKFARQRELLTSKTEEERLALEEKFKKEELAELAKARAEAAAAAAAKIEEQEGSIKAEIQSSARYADFGQAEISEGGKFEGFDQHRGMSSAQAEWYGQQLGNWGQARNGIGKDGKSLTSFSTEDLTAILGDAKVSQETLRPLTTATFEKDGTTETAESKFYGAAARKDSEQIRAAIATIETLLEDRKRLAEKKKELDKAREEAAKEDKQFETKETVAKSNLETIQVRRETAKTTREATEKKQATEKAKTARDETRTKLKTQLDALPKDDPARAPIEEKMKELDAPIRPSDHAAPPPPLPRVDAAKLQQTVTAVPQVLNDLGQGELTPDAGLVGTYDKSTATRALIEKANAAAEGLKDGDQGGELDALKTALDNLIAASAQTTSWERNSIATLIGQVNDLRKIQEKQLRQLAQLGSQTSSR
jgi:hypothetical protein